ncbi:MAG: branched-chain amino acid ABC transporter permease [Clostridiales bacterium]|nr:branched-chain amino acid ABC transporter permease [Clostridia bacterium]MCR5567193.1 branched-chain amino acid ABC transporter permease [Clostridiales bacterium]
MGYFTAQLISAVKLGSIYALVAIGYSIVYSIMGMINFAHGELLMIATFSLWVLLNAGVPFALAVALAILVTALFGILIERIAYRSIRDAGESTQIITSLAVSIFLEALCQAIFNSSSKALIIPDFFSKTFRILDTTVSVIDVVTLACTLILTLAVVLIIRRTAVGKAMRAVADNMEAADLMGIDKNRIITAAFVIGSVLAAVAGILYSGKYTSFSNDMGFMLGVKAFIAAVLGGLGSLTGAVTGGYIMAVLEVFFSGYLPRGVVSYQTAFTFLVLILVLLVRPNGLFGSSNRQRS